MAEDKKAAAKKTATKKKKDVVEEQVQEVALPTVTLNEVATVVEVKEETQEVVVVKNEEVVVGDKEAEIKEEIAALEQTMPEVLQVPVEEKKLSKQAQGWKDWLAYQRMTPEDFLTRYPAHKMRHLIQEIVDFNAKK